MSRVPYPRILMTKGLLIAYFIVDGSSVGQAKSCHAIDLDVILLLTLFDELLVLAVALELQDHRFE